MPGDPKLIRRIHGDYAEAGADVLQTTNTFGANRVALDKFGLADKVRQIDQAVRRIAREVANEAGRPIFVAARSAPCPRSPSSRAPWRSMVVEQVESLIAGGADLALFGDPSPTVRPWSTAPWPCGV